MGVYEQLLSACDDASHNVRDSYTVAAEACALLMEAEILALERNTGGAGHYRLKEVLDDSTKESLLRAMDGHNSCLERRNAQRHQQDLAAAAQHQQNQQRQTAGAAQPSVNEIGGGDYTSPDGGGRGQDEVNLVTPPATLTAPGAQTKADWLRAGKRSGVPGGARGTQGGGQHGRGGGGGAGDGAGHGAPQANTAVFVHLRRLLKT